MKASCIAEAWEMVNELVTMDYERDPEKTARAGYDIMVCPNGDYISDLGNRLEVNFANGKTVNIWIDENAIDDETPKTPETRTETVITLETSTIKTANDETITTRKESVLTLSHKTTLKEISAFEREARRQIKNARNAANRGDYVFVTLTKAKYTFSSCADMTTESFEMWSGRGDQITVDGVHLTPSKNYNTDPSHDMWLTGTSGETFNEITV